MSSPTPYSPYGTSTPRRRARNKESPAQRARRKSLEMQIALERLGRRKASLDRAHVRVDSFNGPQRSIILNMPPPSHYDDAAEDEATNGTNESTAVKRRGPVNVKGRRRRNILIFIAFAIVVVIILLIINPTVSPGTVEPEEGSTFSVSNREADVQASGAIQASDIFHLFCQAREPLCDHITEVEIPGSDDTRVAVRIDDTVANLTLEFEALASLIESNVGNSFESFGIQSVWFGVNSLKTLACVPSYDIQEVKCGQTFPIEGCDTEGMSGSKCDECLEGYWGDSCEICPICADGIARCNDGKTGDGSCTNCPRGRIGDDCLECASGFYSTQCLECKSCVHGTCDDGRTGTGDCQCDEGWDGNLCSI